MSERDATSGEFLRTRSDLPSMGGADLAPTSSGVWISYSTGMMAQVRLLRASDLRAVANYPGWDDEAGSNSTSGAVSGGLLWVDDRMIGRVSCADPGTGRAFSTRDLAAQDVVSDGTTLFAATHSGVALLKPDAECVRAEPGRV